MATKEPLRFAALCRVSTEKQAHERKASLDNQDKQIRAAVEALGGTVTREYKGNQHATPGYEHAMVERLLTEAQRKNRPFDAVMVAEPSRWSRDNVASTTGLDVFRAKGVRFFCGTNEYDLFDPVAAFVLAQFVNMNQFFAATQKLKSLQAKITYAKQGRHASGTLPFGRTWDTERMEWGVDEEKQRLVQDAAKRYLAGESLKDVAAEYGMDRRNLHKTLRHRCGPKLVQRYNVPGLNIDETIELDIPELLDAPTIKAIHQRMDRQHCSGGTGNNKHKYLLAGNVRCIECGAALSPGYVNGSRYYRHAASCKHITGMVRADDLEKVIASQLVGLMGNPAAVAKAVETHQVALGNVGEQQAKVEKLDKELATVAKGQKRTMDLLVKDLIDESVAHAQLAELRERQRKLEKRRDHLAEQIAHIPTHEAVEQAAKRAYRRLQNACEDSLHVTAAELPRAELEAIIAEAFANTTHTNGKWPGGVFIKDLPEFKGRRPRRWAYELHGNLPYTGGELGVDYGHTDLPPEAFEGGGGERGGEGGGGDGPKDGNYVKDGPGQVARPNRSSVHFGEAQKKWAEHRAAP